MRAEATSIPAGYEQTEVGVIPDDWRVDLLDEVAIRGSGHTPNKQKPEYWNGDVRWISLQDTNKLDQRYIYNTAATITPAGIANSSAVMHTPGTVVLSRDAGVGKSAIMASAMAVSQHFMAWRCGPDLHNEFLYYWLQASKREFERIAMGSTIKTIGLPYFRELKVPVPPLAEQEAIAETLGDADAWIESLEQLVAKKRHLKQAAMQQLLTGKKRLPGFEGEWEKKPIGRLFEFKNGLNKAKEFFGYGTPIVNYMDVFGCSGLHVADIKGKVSLSAEEIRSFDVRKGDVFFTRTSETQEEIGTASVMLDDPADTVFSGFVLRARPITDELDDEYKRYCFTTDAVRRATVATASYTTRALTNGRLLSAVELLVPNKDEQRAIAKVFADMELEIEAIEAKLAKARQVKQGMMQELLTGRTRLL